VGSVGCDAFGAPPGGLLTLPDAGGGDVLAAADAGDDAAGVPGDDCVERRREACDGDPRDTDGDGLPDCAEALRRTSPDAPDSDGNGLSDATAVVGERITLAGPFSEPFPALRLGPAALEASCSQEGECSLTVPATLEAGRHALEVAGEVWFELEVVCLALLAAAGDELSRLDCADGTAIGHPLSLPARPGALAVLPGGGRALASVPRADALVIVDVPAWKTHAVLTLPGLPSGVAVDAAGTRAAVELVVAQQVALVALSDPRGEPALLDLPDLPGGVALSPAGDWLAVTVPALGEVQVVPVADGAFGAPVSVPLGEASSPGQVAWDASAGAFLVVAGGAGALARVAPPGEPPALVGLPVVAPVTLSVAPDATVALVGALDGALVAVTLGDVPAAGDPLALQGVPGVAAFPSPARAWVPESYDAADPDLPGRSLAVVELGGGALASTGRLEVPAGPWMVALQPREAR